VLFGEKKVVALSEVISGAIKRAGDTIFKSLEVSLIKRITDLHFLVKMLVDLFVRI
jgi:hypothetical protein